MKKIAVLLLAVFALGCMSVNGGAQMNESIKIGEAMVHDPSVVKDNGSYYVFGSHITTAKSTDLINWRTVAQGYKREGNIHFGNLSETLAGSFKWAGEDDADCKGGFAVWAPDVYYNKKYIWDDGTKGAYMMYYSASSTYKRSCIGLAVSKTIEGPYEYVDTLIYSGFTKNKSSDENSTHNNRYSNTNIDELIVNGRISAYKDDWGIDDYNNYKYPNAIDPCVFEDDRGRLYLTYGSWSGGIFVLRINELDGRVVYPGSDGVTEDGRMIDRYFGTHIAGGKGWSGEGPFIWYDTEEGFYYLQTSYEWLGTDGGYHIRMFRSKSPYGPFTDMKGNGAIYGDNQAEHGYKMFGNYCFDFLSAPYTSGGHSSVLVDDDGKMFVFYHTRFKGTEFFQMRVHQMFMNEDGWPVTAPGRYIDDEVCEKGYAEDEIIGVYEFVNHGNRVGEGTWVNMSKTVQLYSDGRIVGAVEGEWSVDGHDATFVIGDEVFKGLFLKQTLENGQKVMVFSLAGGDNKALWGVKKRNEPLDAPVPDKMISFENTPEEFKTVIQIKNKNPQESSTAEICYGEGIKGKAVIFDGSFGLKAKNVKISDSFTVSFWMKPEKTATYSPIVAITENFTAETQKWFSLTTFTNGKRAMLWSRNAESDKWLEGEAEVGYKFGKWQHATLVFDKKHFEMSDDICAKLYINGLCVATGPAARDAFGEKSVMYFGVNPWDECFGGLIDEMRVFDRALSHDEVRAHYYSFGI